MGGVGVACHGKEAVQGSAKLHGLGWRMWYGVSVDIVKTQIDNQSGTAIPLGHDAQRGQPQVGKVLHQTVGKHSPETLFHKVGHFVADKGSVFESGRVGATVKAMLTRCRGPFWRRENNGCTM